MRLFTIAALAAAMMVSAAAATDTSSLDAFVRSCAGDAKGCHTIVLNAVISARNAKYGCIPADVADETAADRLLDWLKGTAANDPKYQKQDLSDLMWTGIDEVWPCKK